MFSGIGGFELGIQQAYEITGNISVAEVRDRKKTSQTELQKNGEGLYSIPSKTTVSSRDGDNELFNPSNNERQPYCVGYSEIDKYAIQIYSKHFNHKNYGDATTINASELPDFDILVGGFPCQAFSIAGKRLGLDDTRGTLFYDIARIAKEKRPQHLLLENVKGLLSHDNGRTFKLILSTFAELGYDIEWQVLNSKNYGVPQNRERVFIVGHLRGTSRPEVFPIGSSNPKTLKQVIGGSQGFRVYDPDGLATTQASLAGGLGAKTGLYLARVNRKEGVYDMRETETAGTLTSTMYKGIDASGRTGVKEGMKIRRLTPTECERLQGFPDGWTDGGFTNIISLETLLTEQLCQNVRLNSVKDQSSLGANKFALNITSVGKDGEVLISSTLNKERISETADCVIDLLMQESGVCDIISLGNDMATLLSLNGTSQIDEITNKNLILEKMVEKSISQLWKIELAENLPKEKLSIILTWIKEIIKSQTYICVKTEKPITDAIIVYRKSELNYLKGESLSLRMGSIIQISDTQRYKTLGNAVTVNVIREIIRRLTL